VGTTIQPFALTVAVAFTVAQREAVAVALSIGVSSAVAPGQAKDADNCLAISLWPFALG
jgi:hypothetical protein